MVVGIAVLFATGYDKFLPTTEFLPTIDNKQIVTYINDPVKYPVVEQPAVPVDWSQVNVDKVVVYKSQRQIDLIDDGEVIKSYPMRLGFAPIGHKTTEGDGKTPEGSYVLDWRNPQSQFYRSLHISYPNKQDLAQAKERGVSAGGDVMIHGSAKKTGGSKGQPLYSYLPAKDWTWGCISVSNEAMDEIWNNVKNGTKIEIFP